MLSMSSPNIRSPAPRTGLILQQRVAHGFGFTLADDEVYVFVRNLGRLRREDLLSTILDHGQQIIFAHLAGVLSEPALLDHQSIEPQLLVRLLNDLHPH